MAIESSVVKELRARTGVGMMECKRALEETGGDMEKAVEHLRTLGVAKAEKRSGRAATEGRVDAYIHPGFRIGVLLEVNSETDFVAKTDEFGAFVRNIAMQIAATEALVVRREELPAETVEREARLFREEARTSGKPEKILDKIVEGRLEKYFAEVCLLEQPYVRDSEKKIQDILNEMISRTGENIVIRRFAKFRLGE
jgi:elongation factor Ts